MHQIVFVIVEPVYSFDLAIARMVLDTASGYRITVCTADPGRIEAVSGPDVVVDRDLTAVRDADTCIVIGGGGREDTDPRVLDSVRAAAEADVRMAAICTGTFVLAQAGVLDGRRATTHWGLTDELARRHPGVTVVPDVLYVADGPVLTSATTLPVDRIAHHSGMGSADSLRQHLLRRTGLTPTAYRNSFRQRSLQ